MNEYTLPEPAIHAPFYKEYKTVYQGDYFTSDQMQTAYQAGAATLYPLPDALYPGSKDWLTGDYAARVEWLHTGYEAKKAEIESLLQQVEIAHQAVNAEITGLSGLLPGYRAGTNEGEK